MLKVIYSCSVFLVAFTASSLATAQCKPPVKQAPIISSLAESSTKEFVPEWAKHAIWYQIFPERFRNGDRKNDPTVEDIRGADPAEPPKEWKIHPWGSDWYKLQPYEKANGEDELWKHLLRRRYGGDLQGIINKLDYIKEMGFNAIYLNPVFDAPSLHKYDAASYHHIDPNFGPDPEGDRALMAKEDPSDPDTWVWTSADKLALKLISEAHQRGIRVIFDGVFNHMGINSFAFRDLQKNQQNSIYKDWFDVVSFDDEKAGTSFDYKGWFGVKSLPEFKEDEKGLAKGPRDYVFAITERWMNPKGSGIENGIDGWRLDVAFCIAHPFWKEWRKKVKSINPEAFLTAEIVAPPSEVVPYFQGDEFDGEMNYNFAFAAAEFFFNPHPQRIKASEFDKKLADLRNLYPKGVAYVTQNLFGSHDSNRIGSHIVNRGIGNFRDWGEYFNLSMAANNPDYRVSKPTDEDIKLQKLFVIFQMTYVGAPMVYYGDEIGMWGANDPDDRKPMVWPDKTYEPEKTNPDGSLRKPDTVEVNMALMAHYKSLISLRTQYEALRTGSFKTLTADDENEIYGFARELDSEVVWVILNSSNRTQSVTLKKPDSHSFKSVFEGEIKQQAEGTIKLSISRKSAVVLVSNSNRD
jgi:glycosidase